MTENINLSANADDPRQNGILAALPEADFERILPDLKLVPLPTKWTMMESGDLVPFLYFPISGVVSLNHALADGFSSEVALVGNEGMVGISIFMGGKSLASSTEVQNTGKAYKLCRNIMKREFALGGKLQEYSLRYTQALFCQSCQTAVCNQHHLLEQQLCRWLLMSVDRLHSNDIFITQESISNLLGVRRESITQAIGQLQKDGLISATRGHIQVVDRLGLEGCVCECYHAVKKEYLRLLPPVPGSAGHC